MTPTPVCPSCRGSGTIRALTCGDTGCRPRLLVCHRCDGEGTAPPEMEQWMETGQKLRERRVLGVPYRTLQEEAALMQMTPQQLSRLEQGREAGGAALLEKGRP